MNGEFRPFWLHEALERECHPGAEPLRGDIRADVCIVGAGYTGLWTAIHLKQHDPDLAIVVIDQDLCGSGASGRNGGCLLTWSTRYLCSNKHPWSNSNLATR